MFELKTCKGRLFPLITPRALSGFDPLGTHTRAFITDMRPKLFDGIWKEYATQGSNPGLTAPGQVFYSLV